MKKGLSVYYVLTLGREKGAGNSLLGFEPSKAECRFLSINSQYDSPPPFN